MGASDIMNNNSGTDLDSARAERNNRENPPEFAPGQDSFFTDDVFDSGVNTTFSPGGFDSPQGDVFGAGMNGGIQSAGAWNNPMGGMMQNPMQTQGMQNQANSVSTEDKVFDVLGKGAKGSLNFVKDIVQSFKQVTPKFWSSYGSNLLIASLVMAGVGIVVRLFGLKIGTQMFIGGCLSGGLGTIVLMCNVEKGKQCSGKYKDSQPTVSDASNFGQTAPSMPSFDMNDDLGTDSDYEDDDDYFDDDDFSFSDDDAGGDAVSDDMFEGLNSSDDFFSGLNGVSESVQAPLSADEALSQLPPVDKGMYTRQYLYEAFTKVLPNITPDYATMKEIDIESDIALQWEVYLRDAAEVTGIKEENLPSLIKLEENLFTIKLTCTRPIGFKHDAVADEIANIYAYSSGKFNPMVYAKADVMGKSCTITIFTGETAMVSLKDMYKNCQDFVLDTKNYMPVVFGIDQTGQIIKADLRKLESILITGMPRSGKSWQVQALLTQMCAYVSPKELNIYICDPKEGISDFKSFTLPHVKKFVSGDANIVNTLREVVKREAPRRKKIIGDAGNVNIWDYKERHPDVELPIIYVLIDEVVTLAERMEKEVKREFQGLLVELISQLPALGIRAFLVPHVVKNDIIAKTATDLIPCRISVCGDAAHIEACTGTKPKDFPYRLNNTGDMAVRMPLVSASTLFVHGVALTSSNIENNDLFDYMRRLWGTLTPEEVGNSVAETAEVDKQNQSLIANSESEDFLGDVDNLDLFGDTPASDTGTFVQTNSNFNEVTPNYPQGMNDSVFTANSANGLMGFNSEAVQYVEDDSDELDNSRYF